LERIMLSLKDSSWFPPSLLKSRPTNDGAHHCTIPACGVNQPSHQAEASIQIQRRNIEYETYHYQHPCYFWFTDSINGAE
jgi:hypothetical protein